MSKISITMKGADSHFRDTSRAIETRPFSFPGGYEILIPMRKIEWDRYEYIIQNVWSARKFKTFVWDGAFHFVDQGTQPLNELIVLFFRDQVRLLYELEMEENRKRVNDNGSYFNPDDVLADECLEPEIKTPELVSIERLTLIWRNVAAVGFNLQTDTAQLFEMRQSDPVSEPVEQTPPGETYFSISSGQTYTVSAAIEAAKNLDNLYLSRLDSED